MELKKHVVEIINDNPFANDWLEREGFANQLTNIVENNKNGEVVIGLSGQWGEGKTTFVKMWQQYMQNERIPCIYFDAFEYDYLEDVFLSLAIEIHNFAKEKNLTTKDDYLDKSKNTYNLLKAINAQTPPINLDTSIINSANQNESQDFDIAKIIKDSLNSTFSNAFDQALKQKAVFQDFKLSLSKLASEASERDTPLVIIIDELDRCKPSFAVEILEKIKHLFLVKDVIFVLSMHHEQLEESIKKVYGQNIDAHTYLQKFIDYPARLPRADLSNNSNRRKYFWNQLNNIGLDDKSLSSLLNSYKLLLKLSFRYDLSYRQLNKAIQNYKYFIESISRPTENHSPSMFLMVFISILKVKDGLLVSKIRNGTANFHDLFGDVLTEQGDSDYDIELLRNIISMCFYTIDSFKDTEYNSYERKYFDNFSGLIELNENKVLRTLVQRLESFEDY